MEMIDDSNSLTIDDKKFAYDEQHVIDVQPIKNSHGYMEVQVTFLVESFIKK